MFESSFVDGKGKTKSWTMAASVVLECAVVGLMVVLPLLFTDTLPLKAFHVVINAPLPPSAPPPPPKDIVKRPFRKVFNPCAASLCAPRSIPKDVPTDKDSNLQPPPIAPTGANTGPQVPGAPTGNIGDLGPPPSAPPAVVKERPVVLEPPKPVRVGGEVKMPSLLRRVVPIYPALAKQIRVQGTVVFTAIIGRDGSIRELKPVSGPAVLVKPAQEAVAQWLYSPTLLNGEPVEVFTEISVNFLLGQ